MRTRSCKLGSKVTRRSVRGSMGCAGWEVGWAVRSSKYLRGVEFYFRNGFEGCQEGLARNLQAKARLGR